MYNTEEFRIFAAQCVAHANEPGLSKTQQELLWRMAAKWLDLADEADRIKRLMGERIGTAAGAFKVPTSSKIH
jgi:hypothetical protein